MASSQRTHNPDFQGHDRHCGGARTIKPKTSAHEPKEPVMAKVLFLEYPKCSTCKNAKKWLDDHGIEYTDRHIVDENPTADELAAWQKISGLPLRRFFNTSGMKYRELGIKARLDAGMTDGEAFELLATDGMLVKRPLVVTDTTVLTGFKPAEWETALL